MRARPRLHGVRPASPLPSVLFGLLKEGSDVLTAVTNGHGLDWVDTTWDTTANVIGGALALGWLIRRRPSA